MTAFEQQHVERLSASLLHRRLVCRVCGDSIVASEPFADMVARRGCVSDVMGILAFFYPSHDYLIGHIPVELAGMTALTSLDLGGNQFSGE